MAKVTRIKKTVYTNAEYFERVYKAMQDKTYTSGVHIPLRTTRGCNVAGVYKCEYGYHVELDLDDIKHIREESFCQSVQVKRLDPANIAMLFVPKVFPEVEHLLGAESIEYTIIWFKSGSETIREAFGYRSFEKGKASGYFHKPEDFRDETIEFDVYAPEDFVLLPKTQRELNIIKEEEDRKKQTQLNEIFVMDTLCAALKEEGIELYKNANYKYNERTHFIAKDKKVYNDLVLKAINFYLNSITEKHKIHIKQPKLNQNIKLGQYVPIFFLDDVEMMIEVEKIEE